MLRWSVVVLSLVLNLPVLWDGLVKQQVPVEHVIVRFLLTVPIMAVLLASVRVAFQHRAEQPPAQPVGEAESPGG